MPLGDQKYNWFIQQEIFVDTKRGNITGKIPSLSKGIMSTDRLLNKVEDCSISTLISFPVNMLDGTMRNLPDQVPALHNSRIKQTVI